MNLAGKIKASIRDGLNERRADVLANRIAKKKSRAIYRKELVSETLKQAKVSARTKARSKAKRRAEGLRGSIKRIKANLPKDSKSSKHGGYTLGGSSGSPFTIGRN